MNAIPADKVLPSLICGSRHLRTASPKKSETFAVRAGVEVNPRTENENAGLTGECVSDFDKGVAAGKLEAQQEATELHAQALAASQEHVIDAARRVWVEAEGQAICEMMTGAIEALREEICTIVSETLEPILQAELHRRTVDDLFGKLELLTRSKEVLEIEICGPEDLIRSVGETLSSDINNVILRARPGPEVELRVDDTVLRSEIEWWSASLSGGME